MMLKEVNNSVGIVEYPFEIPFRSATFCTCLSHILVLLDAQLSIYCIEKKWHRRSTVGCGRIGKSYGNSGKSAATASGKGSAGALSKFPGTNANDDSCGSSIRDIHIPSPIFTQSAESIVDLLNGDAVVYSEFMVLGELSSNPQATVENVSHIGNTVRTPDLWFW